jgi:hypothetical protein
MYLPKTIGAMYSTISRIGVMSLPKSLQYSVKPAAIQSYTSTFQCYPSNGASSAVFQPSTNMQFNIPTGVANQWLDPAQSWVQMSVKVTLTGGTTPKWSSLLFYTVHWTSETTIS